MLRVRGLSLRYPNGKLALDRCRPRGASRRVAGRAGRQRLRQDDAAALHHPGAGADRGRGLAERQRDLPPRRREAAARAARRRDDLAARQPGAPAQRAGQCRLRRAGAPSDLVDRTRRAAGRGTAGGRRLPRSGRAGASRGPARRHAVRRPGAARRDRARAGAAAAGDAGRRAGGEPRSRGRAGHHATAARPGARTRATRCCACCTRSISPSTSPIASWACATGALRSTAQRADLSRDAVQQLYLAEAA